MDRSVNKVMSFSVEAFESARASAEILLKNLETEINALVAQGSGLKSENAIKVRVAATDASKHSAKLNR